jgi:hypothetical protein
MEEEEQEEQERECWREGDGQQASQYYVIRAKIAC